MQFLHSCHTNFHQQSKGFLICLTTNGHFAEFIWHDILPFITFTTIFDLAIIKQKNAVWGRDKWALKMLEKATESIITVIFLIFNSSRIIYEIGYDEEIT